MKYKIVSAHQPNFLPYLGFFDKMKKSDIFVIRDEVQFVKKEFHNRNRIRINGNDKDNPQSKWVSVPVYETNGLIKDINIKKDFNHKNKNWNELILHDIKVNYNKAPFFENFFCELEKIFDNSEDSLNLLNMKIIKFLAKVFEIKTKIIIASELNLKQLKNEKSDPSQDLADICKALNCNIYLSGIGGKDYLNKNPFIKEGIKVEFQEYNHPTYKQVFNGFLPNMGAIDALFCCGKMPKLIPLEIKQIIR